MVDSRSNYGEMEMIVQVGSLKLKTLDEVRRFIVGQTESIILYDCYNPSPKQTETSIREKIQCYATQIRSLHSQVTDNQLKDQLKHLSSYLDQQLSSSELLENLGRITEETIHKVEVLCPSSEPFMRSFLELSKKRKPFQRRANE